MQKDIKVRKEKVDKDPKDKIYLPLFKTQMCHKKRKHNFKKCVYYHFKTEKRRKTTEVKYCKVMCKKENCQNLKCEFSHSVVEQLYHP